MAPKIAPWIGGLVADELRAVLQWKTLVKQESGIEHVHEGRFSDDGSNLRSSIASPSLGDGHRLQIASVLSTGNLPTLLVSDGVTQMRALLSDDAVAVLEDEMGSALGPDIRGDLFVVRKMTVVSTPWGSEDRYVQIYVEELEYVSHLRKPIGNPSPVEERPEIAQLVSVIGDFRQKQNSALDTITDVLFTDAEQSPASKTPEARSDEPNLIGDLMRHGTKRLRSDSGSSEEVSRGVVQTQVATQVDKTIKKRPIMGPSRRGGFGMVSKVNPSSPQRPMMSSHSMLQKSTATASSSTLSQSQARLLHLLGPLTASKSDTSKTDDRSKAVSDAHSEAGSFTRAAGSPTREKPSPQELHITKALNVAPPPEAVELAKVQPSPADSALRGGESLKPGHVEHDTSQLMPPASLHDPSVAYEGQFAPGSMSIDGFPDGMVENVPLEQQRLLDDPSCWLPSDIGRQLPIPNVPIQLIRQWQIRREGVESAKKPRGDDFDHAETTSEDDGGDSSDSEDPISASQWPPSPQHDMLPPDSTLEEDKADAVSELRVAHQDDHRRGGTVVQISPIRERGQTRATPASSSIARTKLPLRSPRDYRAKQMLTGMTRDHVDNYSRPGPAKGHTRGSIRRSSSYRDSGNTTSPGTDTYRPRHSAGFDPLEYSRAPLHAPDPVSQHVSREHPKSSQRLVQDDHAMPDSMDGASKEFFEDTSGRSRQHTGSIRHETSSFAAQEKISHDQHSFPSPQASTSKIPTRPPIPSALPMSNLHYDHFGAPSPQHQAREVPRSRSPSLRNRIQVQSTPLEDSDDDMEMDIPRPLEDPASLHLRKRFEHFEAGRKQADERSLSLEALQIHPSRRHLIDEGLSEALPAREGLKASTSFNAEQRVDIPSSPATRTKRVMEENSPTQTAAAKDNLQPTATNTQKPSTSEAAKKDRVVDLTEDEVEVVKVQPENAPKLRPASSVRRLITQVEPNNSGQTLGPQEQPLTTFQAFAKAWTEVKPGGAFAVTQSNTEQRRKNEAMTTSALSWGWYGLSRS